LVSPETELLRRFVVHIITKSDDGDQRRSFDELMSKARVKAEAQWLEAGRPLDSDELHRLYVKAQLEGGRAAALYDQLPVNQKRIAEMMVKAYPPKKPVKGKKSKKVDPFAPLNVPVGQPAPMNIPGMIPVGLNPSKVVKSAKTSKSELRASLERQLTSCDPSVRLAAEDALRHLKGGA
jgi:hypothetical protein